MYICFTIATMMLAASPARAADPGPGASAPDRKAIVVRADPRTGKLIRSVVPTAPKAAATSTSPAAKSPSASRALPQISEIVEKAAKAHDVDPLLVHSIIQVESNYDPYAISRKGAEGLMQLTPSTARMLGVSNSFDPQQNIEAGVKYLKQLQEIFKDDQLALAAYNAGPGAVEKFKQQIPPYPETQNYVKQVGRQYSTAKAAEKKPASEKATAAVPPPPEHPKLEQFVDENGRLYLRTAQ